MRAARCACWQVLGRSEWYQPGMRRYRNVVSLKVHTTPHRSYLIQVVKMVSVFSINTRMHSSRMRTTRFSGRLYWGGSASGTGGVCLLIQGVSTTHPFTKPPFPTPPVDRMTTGGGGNITLPQTLFMGGNNSTDISDGQSTNCFFFDKLYVYVEVNQTIRLTTISPWNAWITDAYRHVHFRRYTCHKPGFSHNKNLFPKKS